MVEAKEKKKQFPVPLWRRCPSVAGGVLHSAADRRSMLQNAAGVSWMMELMTGWKG